MPKKSYTNEPQLNSDCRWHCISALIMPLVERLCSGHDAVLDMHEALCSGQLRSMVRTGEGKREWLTPEQWAALDLVWWSDADGNWRVVVVFRETGVYFLASFYLWKPDFDALWSCGSDAFEPHTARTKAETPQPRAMLAARKKSAAKKSRAGTKESSLWDDLIVPFLKKKFPRKPYPDSNTSFHAVKDDCLFNARKSMSDSAIRNGIKRKFPMWFPETTKS